jgi:RNA polymerase sigma factor for flagellar operon FliA
MFFSRVSGFEERMRLSEATASRIDEDWVLYKKTKDPEARERLIIHYAPLVRFVANRLSIGLPSCVDADDLISYGFFGLVDAVERFDLSREVKFETYATRRIQGSIIDGLRSIDWVPRSIRQKSKELERAIGTLEMKFGRPPSDHEIADYMKLSLAEYSQMIKEVKGASLISLDEGWSNDSEDEGNLTLSQVIKDVSSEDPANLVSSSELQRKLAEAIDNLPERERLVVSLYYYEELTLKEIGKVLNVSESRVSQIHTKAMHRLKASLNRYLESLVS